MQRSSESVAAIAAALAKAQIELTNPEKSLEATIPMAGIGGGTRSFRYAPLSSGLDIVRKSLGKHEIATVQDDRDRPGGGPRPSDHRARAFIRRVDFIGVAGLRDRRCGLAPTHGGSIDLCQALRSLHIGGDCR